MEFAFYKTTRTYDVRTSRQRGEAWAAQNWFVNFGLQMSIEVMHLKYLLHAV